MRRFGLALLVSSGFIGSAVATDLPQRIYTKAPVTRPAPAPYNWTGLYVGANIGGSWGSQDNALVSTAGVTQQTTTAHPNGIIGAFRLGTIGRLIMGYWALRRTFRVRAKRATGLFNIPGGGVILVVPPSTVNYTDRLNWFGTLRGARRLGI